MRARLLAPATAILVVAGVLTCVDAREPAAGPAPLIVFDDGLERATIATVPGIVALAGLVTVRVTAPFTLLRVTPLRTDPEVEVLAVRALFWGDSRVATASGYRRTGDNPAGACGNWPVTGYGPTYPVENLRLRPGDTTLALLFYVRSQARGRRGSYGYRLDYRSPGGRVRHMEGGLERQLIMELHPPDDAPKNIGYHPRCDDDSFTSPLPGFPA